MEKEAIVNFVNKRVHQDDYTSFLSKSILKLCSINTIPTRNIKQTGEREAVFFRFVRDTIAQYGISGIFTKHGISPLIQNHPAFTPPFYADKSDAYINRCNLIYTYRSPQRARSGRKVAVNAHIDTVAPFFKATRKGPVIYGRGACDDKSGCTVMIATLRLLEEINQRFNIVPGNDITFMFVIDEESGGNGSLSIALSEGLKRKYDVLVVLECCDQQIHHANRGALWYRIEIPAIRGSQPVLLAMEIVRELEREGALIKSESEHPSFPQRPVQTNHGILGPFGEYPSRICAYVEFLLSTKLSHNALLRLAEKGITLYTSIYGDKTKVIDPKTVNPKVGRHYALERIKDTYLLKIWGSSGHMASIIDNDGAITKASFILTEISKMDTDLGIRFSKETVPGTLIMEGGQGFVPTHSIDDIKARLNSAMLRAVDVHGSWKKTIEKKPVMTFNKLHNDAFDRDPGSPSILDAILCAECAGISLQSPTLGWNASCDARLFACEYPGLEIITTGPGKITYAHSDNEQITVKELAQSCAMLTLFLLVHTGSLTINTSIL